MRQLPGAFGDPFRAVEALPGVTPIITGLPYFFVRGAPPGNVGYFLDGVRVPLLYHIGLGPSVVHPAIVERVDLYPGGYPARYGRFAGGIVAGETSRAALRAARRSQCAPGRRRRAGRGAVRRRARARRSPAAATRTPRLLLSLLAEEVILDYWDYQARIAYEANSRDTVSAFAFGSFDLLGRTRARRHARTSLSPPSSIASICATTTSPSARTKFRLATTLGFDRTRFDDEDISTSRPDAAGCGRNCSIGRARACSLAAESTP